MKYLILLSLILLGIISLSAQDNSLKNFIGLHLVYQEGGNGAFGELVYQRPLSERWRTRFGISYNTRSFGYRAGVSYRLIHANKFSLGLGSQIYYRRYSLSISDEEPKQTELNLEIPITLNYLLSQKLEFQLGYDFTKNLYKDFDNYTDNDHLKIGLNWKL